MSFQESDWRNICKAAEAEAVRRCGSVYEMFLQFYSGLIDGRLDALAPSDRDRALAIARESGAYRTRDEIAADIEAYTNEGYCRHALEPNCCPLGCGDLEVYQ